MFRFRFLILVFFLLSISILGAQDKTPSSDDVVIFPPPPATPRIQYLTRFSTSIDVTGERKGLWKYILPKATGKPIIKPYGIAIKNGKIYICDTIYAGLEILDLKNKKFEYFRPKGFGALLKPVNCFVDDAGDLYVSDTERRQVVIFTPDLKYKGVIGDPTKDKPTDVFVKDDEIWVCDIGFHAVDVYDRQSLNFKRSLPLANSGEPESLFSPVNIFVTDKYLYVTDFGDFKVKTYTHDGEFVQSVGGFGRSIGNFVRPKGIAVDRDNNLFVVDAGFENVQIFDSAGKLLMFFGGAYEHPGNMWLPAKVIIDYDNLEFFQKYVHPSFNLKYLIFVTNQYGPDKVSVYGFIEPKS